MLKQPNMLPDSHVGLLCFEGERKNGPIRVQSHGHILLVEDEPGITGALDSYPRKSRL